MKLRFGCQFRFPESLSCSLLISNGLIENIEHVTTLVLFQFFGNVHNPHDTVSFILIHIHRSALRLESCKICIVERSLPALFVVIIM